jgi:hypothetical protein
MKPSKREELTFVETYLTDGEKLKSTFDTLYKWEYDHKKQMFSKV